MRKIIQGKVYDTDSAKLVGGWDNGMWDSDFDLEMEELYRKRTGEYFLYGSGGARTKFAQSDGYNSWTGGSVITPLTYEQAESWAQDNLKAKEYEAEFGTPQEGEAAVSVRVPAATKHALEAEAARRGVPQAQLVEEALEAFLGKAE